MAPSGHQQPPPTTYLTPLLTDMMTMMMAMMMMVLVMTKLMIDDNAEATNLATYKNGNHDNNGPTFL